MISFNSKAGYNDLIFNNLNSRTHINFLKNPINYLLFITSRKYLGQAIIHFFISTQSVRDMERSYDAQHLLSKAKEYDICNDHYNAIKLYKKVIRLSPQWGEPYRCLGEIYKYRREWKPSFYYIQKALEINPDNEKSWWSLGIVATALKKWRWAREAWNKVGYQLRRNNKALVLDMGAVPVRLNPKGKAEIVWATRIGPVRAVIESIPHPDSGKNYHDIVLLDTEPSGFHIVKNKRIRVYDELEVIKTSRYKTFSVVLETADTKAINILDRLCLDADLGFDNWSKATHSLVRKNNQSLPEYHSEDLDFSYLHEAYLVAIAAHSEKEVQQVLKNWEIITLYSYRDVELLSA